MKQLSFFTALLLAAGATLGAAAAWAQGVGVGTAAPAASAALDVSSTTKGLLAPRLTAAQRAAIASPAQGLLVYQTDGPTPGLWQYSGTAWSPLSRATDLELPFAGAAAAPATGYVFQVQKTDNANNRAAVAGLTTADGVGVVGYSPVGTGVVGINGSSNPGFVPGAGVSGGANTGPGVVGLSVTGDAVMGRKDPGSTGRTAFFDNRSFVNDSATVRVSNAGYGSALAVSALVPGGGGSGQGRGVYAVAGSIGVWGLARDGSNAGVIGDGLGGGLGVLGRTESTNSSGAAVYGADFGTGAGVEGRSATGPALRAAKTATQTGSAAEFSNANASNFSDVVSVNTSGSGFGLHVVSSGSRSTAYFEKATGGSGNAALRTLSSVAGCYGLQVNHSVGAGTALRSEATQGIAGDFVTNSAVGVPTVRLVELGTDYARLNFERTSATTAWTVAGLAQAAGSANTAFLNFYYTNLNNGTGGNAMTIRGDGQVYVPGSLGAGAKTFRIDHPLDPENKYLVHSCVESPDMLNVYNGNAALDAQGAADVQLPTYFEALNQEFRYQLTALGAPGPNLYVVEEIRGNRFRIAGGTPGGRVSWQVTGVRHDRYAAQHRIVPEEAKEPENRGRYLHPEVFGLPAARGINAAPAPAGAPRPAPPRPDPEQPAPPAPATPGAQVARPGRAAGTARPTGPLRPMAPEPLQTLQVVRPAR